MFEVKDETAFLESGLPQEARLKRDMKFTNGVFGPTGTFLFSLDLCLVCYRSSLLDVRFLAEHSIQALVNLQGKYFDIIHATNKKATVSIINFKRPNRTSNKK